MVNTIKLLQKPLCIMVIMLLVTGCMGRNYRPVVDPKGTSMAHYEADLYECQQIAGEVSIIEESAGSAFVGATAGAVVGAIGGAFFGDPGYGAAAGSVYGGGHGAVDGAVGGLHGQSQVVARCLSGRGYRVLR